MSNQEVQTVIQSKIARNRSRRARVLKRLGKTKK